MIGPAAARTRVIIEVIVTILISIMINQGSSLIYYRPN